MLVSVSTVSFWLDEDSVPARVTLGVTVLLTGLFVYFLI